jgi:hypothetical protein
MRRVEDVTYPTRLEPVHGMQATAGSTGKVGAATKGKVRVPRMRTRGIKN